MVGIILPGSWGKKWKPSLWLYDQKETGRYPGMPSTLVKKKNKNKTSGRKKKRRGKCKPKPNFIQSVFGKAKAEQHTWVIK